LSTYLIDARAGVSQIHGIGLIAHVFIPCGTRVWVLQPGFDLILTETEVSTLSEPARNQVFWYAYFDPHRKVYILSSDDDRFTNHSDEPNTANEGDDVTYALRDIQAGEEITWDYRGWGKLGYLHF
jgi:uncharacterized protein